MKDIQERADEFASRPWKNVNSSHIRMAYSKGAEEQRIIDWMEMVDTVYQWLLKNLPNTTVEDIMNDNPTICNRDEILKAYKEFMESHKPEGEISYNHFRP